MNAARWRHAPVAHRAMLVGALTTAMFAGAWNVAQSQNEPTPAYPQADKHRPSTLADRVVLTYEGDPSNSQSVTWRTDATVKTAQAQIAKSGEGPRFKSGSSTVLATRNLTQTTNLGYDSVYHTVRFTGLTSKTKYLYRLGDGTNWTEWYEFQTASATRSRSRSSITATRRTTSRSTGRASRGRPSRTPRTRSCSCTRAT